MESSRGNRVLVKKKSSRRIGWPREYERICGRFDGSFDLGRELERFTERDGMQKDRAENVGCPRNAFQSLPQVYAPVFQVDEGYSGTEA